MPKNIVGPQLSLKTGKGVWGWVGEWVLDKWHILHANTYYKQEYSVL